MSSLSYETARELEEQRVLANSQENYGPWLCLLMEMKMYYLSSISRTFITILVFPLFFLSCGDGGVGGTPTASNLKIIDPSAPFTILVAQEREVSASGGNGTYVWSVNGGAEIISTRSSSITLRGAAVGSFKVTVQSGKDEASLDFTVEPGVDKVKIQTLIPAPGADVVVKFGDLVKAELQYTATAKGMVLQVFPSEDGKTIANNARAGSSSVQLGEGDLELTFTIRSGGQNGAEVRTCCVIANLIDRESGEIISTSNKKAKYRWEENSR